MKRRAEREAEKTERAKRAAEREKRAKREAEREAERAVEREAEILSVLGNTSKCRNGLEGHFIWRDIYCTLP